MYLLFVKIVTKHTRKKTSYLYSKQETASDILHININILNRQYLVRLVSKLHSVHFSIVIALNLFQYLL